MRSPMARRMGRAGLGAVLFWWLLPFVALPAVTSGNATPPSRGGSGAGAISGYMIDDIHYSLANDDPRVVQRIEFSLDSDPGTNATIEVRLSTDGAWFSCLNTGLRVACPTPGTVLQDISDLSVVVAQ